MKVVVTNAVLSNTGDAAIYASIISSLDHATNGNIEVSVFDSNASLTSGLYPEWNVLQQMSVSPPREPARLRQLMQRCRRFFVRSVTANRGVLSRSILRALTSPLLRSSEFGKSWAALRSADVVISSGGTYLVDHYNFESRCDEFELCKSLGKNVVLWTQSLGPFETARSRSLAARVLAAADGVFFRDERSRISWERLGPLPSLERVVPDVVFALPVPAKSAAQGRPRPRALISVREWSTGVNSESLDTGRYEVSMKRFASQLVGKSWAVEAMSTCQGLREYAHDDSRLARRLFANEQVDVNEGFHRPNELLTEMAAADLVIATRMHFSIMALISQVPVIAIAYEFKTLELFESLGLGEFVVAIEDITPAWADETLGRALEDPNQLVLSADRLHQLRAEAHMPAQLLLGSGLAGVRVDESA